MCQTQPAKPVSKEGGKRKVSDLEGGGKEKEKGGGGEVEKSREVEGEDWVGLGRVGSGWKRAPEAFFFFWFQGHGVLERNLRE